MLDVASIFCPLTSTVGWLLLCSLNRHNPSFIPLLNRYNHSLISSLNSSLILIPSLNPSLCPHKFMTTRSVPRCVVIIPHLFFLSIILIRGLFLHSISRSIVIIPRLFPQSIVIIPWRFRERTLQRSETVNKDHTRDMTSSRSDFIVSDNMKKSCVYQRSMPAACQRQNSHSAC